MMNRFVVNHEVPDGFLTVLEQMPGTIVWKDVSQNLPLGTIHPPDCLSRTGIITLSPIIMVQWKIGPLLLNENDHIGDTPIFHEKPMILGGFG